MKTKKQILRKIAALNKTVPKNFDHYMWLTGIVAGLRWISNER